MKRWVITFTKILFYNFSHYFENLKLDTFFVHQLWRWFCVYYKSKGQYIYIYMCILWFIYLLQWTMSNKVYFYYIIHKTLIGLDFQKLKMGTSKSFKLYIDFLHNAVKNVKILWILQWPKVSIQL